MAPSGSLSFIGQPSPQLSVPAVRNRSSVAISISGARSSAQPSLQQFSIPLESPHHFSGSLPLTRSHSLPA
eukprot:6578035-Lingulodinium_polyedra.AAC.1